MNRCPSLPSLHLLLRQRLYPFPFFSDHYFDPPNPLLGATYSIRSRGDLVEPLASLRPGVSAVMLMDCQLFHPKQTTPMLILLFDWLYYLTCTSIPHLMCIFVIVTGATQAGKDWDQERTRRWSTGGNLLKVVNCVDIFWFLREPYWMTTRMDIKMTNIHRRWYICWISGKSYG